MSIKWFVVIVYSFTVYSVQELLADKVQLYGVDVDSIIEELKKTKNQLRGKEQVDNDNLNTDEIVSLLYEGSRLNDPVPQRVNAEQVKKDVVSHILKYHSKPERQKLQEEHANRHALDEILNYYSKPRYEPVKKFRHDNEYDHLQKILNVVNKSNKLKSESTEETLNKPKIYVLDMENLRNIELLNDVVNSLPNTKKNNRVEKPNNIYKGFVVHDGRRLTRDSKEAFAGKDSLESDYKPAKRPRGDHFAGRTAIPYVKNRGDIYEREDKFVL